MDALIRIRNIEKSYAHGPGKTFVLRRVSLDIEDGDFVSIMGPPGAGHPTVLHILGTPDAAFAGEYPLMDEPVHELPPKRRAELGKQHVGFVFQSYHLLDDMTVYENLEVPLTYRNFRRAERQGMVADVLDRFQIVGKKDLYPNQLSGGQQQLVAAAPAVIAPPQIILAADPTRNVRSSQGEKFMGPFKQPND